MKTISCKALAFVSIVLITTSVVCAEETAVVKSVRKPVVLPGLVVDFQKRCVDLEAKVCLDAGYLELIACTKGSKEHESIVSVSSKALHIHTALLLLEMPTLVDEKNQRWVNLATRGDPGEVMLVLPDSNGKPTERPIRNFVERSTGRLDEVSGNVLSDPSENVKPGEGPSVEFPKVFLFSGSRLRDAGTGPKQYLADLSGNIVSIATFGDEVLCLPSHQTQQNSALMWQVKSDALPKVGTMVTLRLRPRKKSLRPELNKK